MVIFKLFDTKIMTYNKAQSNKYGSHQLRHQIINNKIALQSDPSLWTFHLQTLKYINIAVWKLKFGRKVLVH